MKAILLCAALSAVLAARCEVRQVLEPLKPGEIVARGWLKEQLELSLSGMGGHLGEIEPDQMEKPYVTRDFNPANGARGLVGWCAEMGGEYALGAAMLAYTFGDDALVAKAAARVKAAMSLQEPDGYLGAYRPGDNRQEDYNAWGCHLFYNAMLLEYYRTGDKAILDAVHRGLLWFVRNWADDRKTDYVGPTIIEPAAAVYRLTGDRRLLDFGTEYAAWLDKPGRKHGATFTTFPLHRHAYHVAALAVRMKLPAALALAANRPELLAAAEKALGDFREGVGWQATYAPCADGEWTAAPSCVGETEYCDYIFFLELFHLLETLHGDGGYADAIERLVFNAAQGARGKDERTIGYMTSPNQWYATLKSSRWGPEPFYGVYAPNVNAACCPANSIRLYPLYVMRAVLREGCNLCVMNYGPYAVRTEIDGAEVSIASETDYPFDGRIMLRVKTDGWRGALRLRRPAWAESVNVARNGKTCAVRDDGGILTVAGPWRKEGETITVDFGWRPVVKAVRDRDLDKAPLKTVEWGALVFAQPVEETWTPVPRPKLGWGADEAPPQPKEWPWFDVTCKNEPVPYALPQGLSSADIQVVRDKELSAHPWQKPPVKLIVPMVRASAAYPLESRDGVHTPKPSHGLVAPDDGAKAERVEFVPFGATCLRTTCFPIAASGFADVGKAVLFGGNGLVDNRSAALAELVPWKAPNAALKLVDEKVEHLGGGAYAVTRIVKNVGGEPVTFKDELRVRDCFAADRYLIPCVNYNGNTFGALKTPKGLSCEGRPWVFSYERTGIPSCTLTENGSVGLAVFAANDTKESLVSACSLERFEKFEGDEKFVGFEHVIVRPVTEAPYTYESKGVFGPRYDTYITLGAGETFTAKSYVCVCRPKWPNYAYAALIGHALRLLDPQLKPCLTDGEVFDLGIRYIHSLLYLYKGKWLVNEHVTNRMAHDCAAMRITREEMAERMKWEYWTDLGTYCQTFEVGWAGQNFLNARMLAVKAFATSDEVLLEKAIGVFDAFVATQYPSGLLHTCYNYNFDANRVERRPADACNMGWAAAEAVRMKRLLATHGMDKPEYVTFARGICDFFVKHWSDEWGFGKSWRVDGQPAARAGTIGGFLIPALVELYDETNERKYLAAALKASDFYFKRDLDRFECTAGAIDCYCIDKETAWPFLNGSLSLYRLTGDAKHLERAERAAAYFTSWMFFFDGVYGPETDIAKHGWHTTGGTSVSAEHQGIDSWGSIAVPDLEELSDLTGDRKWRRIAGLMWANAMQCITTRLGEFYHGQQRPIGSQSEACFQARFTKYRPVIEAGYMSDILAPWPSAFRMWTVERRRNHLGGK